MVQRKKPKLKGVLINHRDGFLRCGGEAAYSSGGTVPRGMGQNKIPQTYFG